MRVSDRTDSEETAPLSVGPGFGQPPAYEGPPPSPFARPSQEGPQGPEPAWSPPAHQPPPHQFAGQFGGQFDGQLGGPAPDHFPPPGTQPMPAYGPPVGRHRPERGRVSRWIWPAVCALALVIGGLAGAIGGAAYERWSTPDGDGLLSGGLSGGGATTQAPLPVENGSVAAVAQAVLPSTVQILAQYQGQDDGATGSGFVLDGMGHFVTNNHVVADAA